MKKIVLFCLVLLPMLSSAQHLKVTGGSTLSFMKKKNTDGFTSDGKFGFNAKVGIDYLQLKHFYISSEVGYISTGEKDSQFRNSGGTSYGRGLTIDNLHVNTIFRGKLTFAENCNVFLGVGPKLDYQIRYSTDKNVISNESKKAQFGVKADAGFFYDLDRWRFGAEYAYLYDFKASISKMTLQYHSLSLSIGYKLSNR